MPENPLLPNAQLRALHALLTQTLLHDKALRGRGRPRSTSPSRLPNREALLAGTLLQLCPGDILVAEPNDPLPNALLRSRQNAASILELSAGAPQLTLAAALANGLQQTGSDRLVFVLLRAGADEPQWAKTLASAEQSKLPLIVAFADPSGDEAFRLNKTAASAKPAPITWTTIQKTASKHKLPVLSVDGEDAVAVYRVMQESVLRARSGGGPAILWAMLPDIASETRERPKSALPLRRLERYLKTRDISL